MIIDAQVHVWTDETPERPWPAGGRERVHTPFTLTYPKMLALMDEAGVDRVIIVPPSWEGDRNDYALEAAQKYPDRFAVMGCFPVTHPDARKLLARHMDSKGMLGIRLTFSNAQSTWLHDGTLDWFWPAVAEAGISIMAHPPKFMPEFAEVARKYPNLHLIVDHMGLSMDISRDNTREEAIQRTAALARFPNVAVKSLVGPALDLHQTYPFADMASYIERLVKASVRGDVSGARTSRRSSTNIPIGSE